MILIYWKLWWRFKCIFRCWNLAILGKRLADCTRNLEAYWSLQSAKSARMCVFLKQISWLWSATAMKILAKKCHQKHYEISCVSKAARRTAGFDSDLNVIWMQLLGLVTFRECRQRSVAVVQLAIQRFRNVPIDLISLIKFFRCKHLNFELDNWRNRRRRSDRAKSFPILKRIPFLARFSKTTDWPNSGVWWLSIDIANAPDTGDTIR